MIPTLYFATFLVSLIVTLMILLRHKRTVSLTLLFSVLITLNSLGRFMISTAQTMELALMGNIFQYAGACFCPILVVKVQEMLCHNSLPKWVIRSMVAIATIIFAMMLTIGHLPIYYEDCSLVLGNGFSYLDKTYGPGHILYNVYTIYTLAVIVYEFIYALSHREQVTVRTMWPIALIAVDLILSYVLERVLNTRISLVSLGYLVTMLVFLHLQERVIMYDMSTNIISSINAMKIYGYMEFDSEYRYIGCNSVVRELFPESKDWKIDVQFPEDNSFIYQNVISWMYTRQPNEEKILSIGNKYYQLFVRPIPYQKKDCVGYMLEMVDKTSQIQYMNTIKNYNTDLKNEVASKTAHLARYRDNIIVGMATAVEGRDDNTGDHIKRTYGVMGVFSHHLLQYQEELGVDVNFLEMVTRAAPMHDLGKIAVDDDVLKKKGRFTPEEFNEMKKHSAEGAKIVHQLLEGTDDQEFAKIAENIAHYHHEKWNGQGYPAGLSGTDIPLEARLMALADVFDALVSKRCYKDAYSFDEAFDIIKDSIGSHFDPQLGTYFLECRPKLEQLYKDWIQEDRTGKALLLDTVKAQKGTPR